MKMKIKKLTEFDFWDYAIASHFGNHWIKHLKNNTVSVFQNETKTFMTTRPISW